jgi:4-hydroxy-2-oxoglutarate aldolase
MYEWLTRPDVKQFKEHVVKLAKIGMQPVVCGSMGEAFHLSHDERLTLFTAAREALDEAGLNDTVVIAGT